MPVKVDDIIKRKLFLVKQLYQQAEKQASGYYSFTSAIMAAIGFDLAIETLLKTVLGALDPDRTPDYRFSALFDRCDELLEKNGLPLLTSRAHVLHVHAIRNDAQHKAKYPNQIEISDCRTYTRDFCREVVVSIWGLNFDALSPIEWIANETLQELLKASIHFIEAKEFKKGVALAKVAFEWGSGSLHAVLPESAVDWDFDETYPEFANLVNDLAIAHHQIEQLLLSYTVTLTSGINLVDYKRFMAYTPEFIILSELLWGKPDTTNEQEFPVERLVFYWKEISEIDTESAYWIHGFVVNSLINWQTLGLTPQVKSAKHINFAKVLVDWKEDQIKETYQQGRNIPTKEWWLWI